MALDRIDVSRLVPSQVPGFVRAEYQTFILFIQAYYDYLSQSGVAVDMDTIRDLDYSVDTFISHIKSEIAPKLPINIADKRFLSSRLKDLYDAKGSTNSIKLLFRLLYGQEADVIFPSKQMLIPSDGRWTQPWSVFVNFSVLSGDVFGLHGKIVNVNSGGVAIEVLVDRVEPVQVIQGGVAVTSPSIYQVFINRKYNGVLKTGASLSYISGPVTFTGTLVDASSNITISSPGSGFNVGEIYPVNTLTGYGAQLKVEAVSATGGITQAKLIAAGVNYASSFSTSLFAKKYASPTTANNANSTSFAGSTYTDTFFDVTNPMTDAGTVYRFDYMVDTSYMDPDYVGTPLTSFFDVGSSVSVDPALAATIQITTGPLVKYPGYFLTNAGFLSDALYLQDSDYYQQFSYVVKLNQSLDTYAGVLKSLLHPAGTSLFGQWNLQDELSFDSVAAEDLSKGGFQDTTYTPDMLAAYGTRASTAWALVPTTTTNLCTISDPAGAGWSNSAGVLSVTGSSTTGPDGSLSAVSIIEDTTTNTRRRFFPGLAYIAGNYYTMSVFVKYNGRNIQLSFASATHGANGANFDLQAGTIGTINGGVTASITPAGYGFFRCSITALCTASGTAVNSIWFTNNTSTVVGGSSYLGNGTSGFYAYGGQTEIATAVGPFVNNTTGAALTAKINALQQYGADAMRILPSPVGVPALLREQSTVNVIPNNSMSGAVIGTIGSGGALPTGWSVNATGCTVQVLDKGIDNGIPYIDVRFSGTTGATFITVTPVSATAQAATVGQNWTASWFVSLVAGSYATLNNVYVRCGGVNSSGQPSEQTDTPIISDPAGGVFSGKRRAGTKTLASGTTTNIRTSFETGHTLGAVVDFTVRLGAPQLEMQASVTSPVLTTSGAVSRARDILSVPSDYKFGDPYSSLIDFVMPFGGIGGDGVFYRLTGDSSFPEGINTVNGTLNWWNGTTVLNGAAPGYTANSRGKVAYSFDNTGRAQALNGGTVASDTALSQSNNRTYFGGVTDLNDGQSPVLYIHQFVTSRRRWTNAELIAKST